MVSKGVQVYSYIAVGGIRIHFYVPEGSVDHQSWRTFASDGLQVDSGNLPWYEYEGEFGFQVFSGDTELTHQWVDISSLSGNLGDGTMNTISQMRSIVVNNNMVNLVITYGFYDAGSGVAGLPNMDQCYVTVTSEQSGWMGLVAPVGSAAAAKSAGRFALPAPHDCGMNTMEVSDTILYTNPLTYLTYLSAIPGVGNVTGLLPSYAHDVIFALSVTQKDPIPVLFQLGARYFEFRPALIPAPLILGTGIPADEYFFVHNFIPGLSFSAFLNYALAFLEANMTEIVVVQIRNDGVNDNFTNIDPLSLIQTVAAAQAQRNSPVQTASEDEFNTLTIDQLRSANKRLVITQESNQYSSYGDANATLDPGPIVNEFQGMSSDAQAGHTFTLLQCQGTATSIQAVLMYSVAFSNASTSPLMCTKASFDRATLPWIRDNGQACFDPDKSLVIMNDWLDGATCDIAIQLSRERLGTA